MNTGLMPLSGLSVLVVEDEPLIAQLICATLEHAKASVVGPCHTLRAAEQAIGTCAIDAGVLDVNVTGEKIFPVAEHLHATGTPFLLLSGYGRDAIPAHRPEWRAVAKPFRMSELVSALAEQIAFIAATRQP